MEKRIITRKGRVNKYVGKASKHLSPTFQNRYKNQMNNQKVTLHFNTKEKTIQNFGQENGFDGSYIIEDSGNRIQVSYSYNGTSEVIDIQRRWILKPAIRVNGEVAGKIVSRNLKWKKPKLKSGFQINNKFYCLRIDSGPQHALSLNKKDWKLAFSKESKLGVYLDEDLIGYSSSPSWAADDFDLELYLPEESELVPFFVLTFLELTEPMVTSGGGDG